MINMFSTALNKNDGTGITIRLSESLPREHKRRLETVEMKYCVLYKKSEDITELGFNI